MGKESRRTEAMMRVGRTEGRSVGGVGKDLYIVFGL